MYTGNEYNIVSTTVLKKSFSVDFKDVGTLKLKGQELRPGTIIKLKITLAEAARESLLHSSKF